MGWFKVDDQLAFHAKTVMAGNSAMGLWVRAGAWSSAHLTGGFVPSHMALAMANMANDMANGSEADALVMAGLWDEAEGGYMFHGWGKFQPSAEEEKEKREATRKARSDAGKRGAKARWEAENGDGKNGKPIAKPKQTDSNPDGKPMAPTRPDPTLVKNTHSPSALEGFDEFWSAYPKKVAKKAAQKIWERSVKDASPKDIINGAKRYAEYVKREKTERNFIKSPDGWLNAGRWEDEIPSNTNQPASKNPLWDA